jgi:hypothetical protein
LDFIVKPRFNRFDAPPKTAQPSVSKVIPIKGGLLMRILTSLAGQFLSAPLPKAVLVTLVWLGGRSHPVIRASEDWPEHLFEVDEGVSGYSLTGPLTGVYGEPGFELILRKAT